MECIECLISSNKNSLIDTVAKKWENIFSKIKVKKVELNLSNSFPVTCSF